MLTDFTFRFFSVKQALMEHSVTKLAVFFGKQKANDVILSHMITFLNDKEDPQLRLSFYENIVGVAAFVGKKMKFRIYSSIIYELSSELFFPDFVPHPRPPMGSPWGWGINFSAKTPCGFGGVLHAFLCFSWG